MLISEFLNLKCRSEDFDLEVKHYEIRLKTSTILAQYFMLYLQWHDLTSKHWAAWLRAISTNARSWYYICVVQKVLGQNGAWITQIK